MRKHMDIQRLRFLLYPSGLTVQDRDRIEKHDAGLTWLSKD